MGPGKTGSIKNSLEISENSVESFRAIIAPIEWPEKYNFFEENFWTNSFASSTSEFHVESFLGSAFAKDNPCPLWSKEIIL